MMVSDKTLSIGVDLYGCPNRCRHCWLGHMPNRKMEEDADRFVMGVFSPFFDKIAFYSWIREPDYCDHYRERWERDLMVSKNAIPERFELASFYRIVRDPEYIPFLKSVGVRKVQLTFFGLKKTQDRYVGRKGAYEEVLKATDLLIEGGIIPRWQCVLNEENIDEIIEVYHMAQKIRETKCPELEFFVHEGSCDGENLKLYPIRIIRDHIPKELASVYLNYETLTTEKECVKKLREDDSCPEFPVGEEIVLNVSNTYDVYYNYTEMSDPWIIGNLKKDEPEELVRRILNGDTYALNELKKTSWKTLTAEFGDPSSERVFDLGDYRLYLVNEYLKRQRMPHTI
ncbi:MAG: hypothetical protein IIZ47_02040 [Erysipelotrichaceae bacterium]|nr:hypothetical protein [Erysipelotrichaceae bacterium]